MTITPEPTAAPIATRCGVCRRQCVPMADYDAPICHHCDLDVEAIMARANLDDRTRAHILPPTRLPVRRGAPDSYYGAGKAAGELLGELFPTDRKRYLPRHQGTPIPFGADR